MPGAGRSANMQALGVPVAPLDARFGPWLRRLRLSKGLSQRDVAERGGLSHSTVVHFEQNRMKRSASVQAFENLARGLDIDLGWLLHKSGVDVARDGVDLHRLQRTEAFVLEFERLMPQVRLAMADAVHALGLRSPDPGPARQLAVGLAHLDRIAEALRNTQIDQEEDHANGN